MTWPLMTEAELHKLGIEAIVPSLPREGVTVEAVNTDPAESPQIIGKRWGASAFVLVRTACYPKKGELGAAAASQLLALADKHQAHAFFASVGVMCIAYPDGSLVTSDGDRSLPIKEGTYAIAYEGLVVVTASDRVTIWPPE